MSAQPAKVKPDYMLKSDSRRTHERIETEVDVLVLRGSTGWHLHMADLSGSGCRLLRTEHCDLRMGDPVSIYTTAGEGVPVEPLTGRIVRESERHFGVVFED